MSVSSPAVLHDEARIGYGWEPAPDGCGFVRVPTPTLDPLSLPAKVWMDPQRDRCEEAEIEASARRVRPRNDSALDGVRGFVVRS